MWDSQLIQDSHNTALLCEPDLDQTFSFTHFDSSKLIFFVLRSLTARYTCTFMYQRILTPRATLSAKIQLQEL